MSTLEESELAYKKIDKLLKIFLVIFFVYVGVLLSFLVAQSVITQNTIVRNQSVNREAAEERLVKAIAATNAQHKVTQNYIKCIAAVLIKPANTPENPNSRTQKDFDACGLNANVK